MSDALTPGAAESIALLGQLVAIPSVSGEESAAAEALVRWMSDQGFHAGVDEVGNAVGQLGDGEREILLLGHIDTFPGVVPVRREGDLLYGRGTVDAKGPLCAFAAAAAVSPVPRGWRVTVVGAVEEEVWTSRGARHVAAERDATPPRYCIIGEPSRWNRITVGYKGCLEAFLTLRCPFAHSAGPAALPAERGVELWHAVVRFCERRNASRPEREFDRLSPSLRSIASEAEGTHGIVRLGLSFRLSPHDEVEKLKSTLEADLLEAVTTSTPLGATLDVGFRGAEPAHRSSKNTPLVRAMLSAIRGNDGAARFVTKTGTSDLNVVGPRWPDTPVVAYGPGDSSLDHTPDEHIDLNEYVRAVNVLVSTIASLVNGD